MAMSSAPVTVGLQGVHALVTGANTGIGKVTALELARAGARVTLACRTESKALAAMADIRAAVPGADLSFHHLDLGELSKVRASAAALLARDDEPIDLLINNAGLGGMSGMTPDGYETHFGVNHLGPFLFTLLVLDRVKASSAPRIVNVASKAHYKAKPNGIDWDAQTQKTATVGGFAEYCVSKLCNVLFSFELARRLPEVPVYTLHPGVIASDVWRKVPWPFRSIMKLFMISVEEGALTTLHCATAPDAAGKTALYWDSSKPKTPSHNARDEALAAELWRRSISWVGLEGADPTDH